MKFEIVDPQVLSTTGETFTELADNVYQRNSDGAILICGADKAIIVNSDSGTD